MRIRALLVSLLLLCHPLHAGWIVKFDSRIVYSAKAAEGHATFEEALNELSESGRTEKLDGIVAHELLEDDTLQREIFAGLESSASRQLSEALKSAGNMHNPKLRELWPFFEKALLATPTISALNASLARHRLIIARPSVEKFELRSTPTDARRRFHGSLWLHITKMPSPAGDESD